MKIFEKIKKENGRRHIYFLGVKIASYKKRVSEGWGKKLFCPICNYTVRFLPMGKPSRYNVRCSFCQSLERHRFFYFIYKKYFLDTDKKIKIMHTAPEKCISEVIKKNKNIEYYPVDLFPEVYDFVKCKKEDVTNLTFENNIFDYIISVHVMEHIEDEGKFLSEMLRVLKKDGKLFLSFPIYFNLDQTFQDNRIKTDSDRFKFYGQFDHVIKYGKDVIERLKTDFGAETIMVNDFFSKNECKKYNVVSKRKMMKDVMFIITKKG